MIRSISVVFSLVFIGAASLAFTKDEPVWKNLKILPKKITEEQMDSVMHHFAVSLNVDCEFCHVKKQGIDEWDMASDDKKHKLRAREMMIMTDKINDKYFDVTGGRRNLNSVLMVTCYTCHHGNTDPQIRPAELTVPQQSDSSKSK